MTVAVHTITKAAVLAEVGDALQRLLQSASAFEQAAAALGSQLLEPELKQGTDWSLKVCRWRSCCHNSLTNPQH